MNGLHKEQKYPANVKGVYIYSRNSYDPTIKAFYIKYCKILNKVIKEAKKQHYSRLVTKSDNKIQTTWNIIEKETGKIYLIEQMLSLLINTRKKCLLLLFESDQNWYVMTTFTKTH
jgi:hypothetical protein